VLLEKPTLAAHRLGCSGSVKMMMMMMMMMTTLIINSIMAK
jgi:hypothetical protein